MLIRQHNNRREKLEKLDVSEIPQLDVNVLFDTEEAHSHNVVHPIFIPILIGTAMLV